MPVKAPYIASCGCVVKPGERCQHMRRRDAERKAIFDQRRPSASARGYDSKWQKARRAYLAEHPYCVKCGSPAKVVDHIVPHKGDKALFWAKSNWQSLCTPCHSQRKQREERRGT